MAHCPKCGKTYNTVASKCKHCGHEFMPRSDVLAPGTVLQARYEVETLAHTGGMGYVYLAKDRKLYDRLCVVKQVKEPVGSDEVRLGKLQEEAMRMAKLSHPNVAMVLDHFVEEGYYFLVMEHIQGEALSQVFQRHRPTEREVLQWALCMCDVVSYIHQEGIIHRDISPDNIMLKPDGSIKFIDFGTLRELRYIAAKGTVGVGKFGYTPPEQWHNKPVRESDIFALGATVYYLLTGFLPVSQEYLRGKGPQDSDFNPVFPPIRQKNPSVSLEMEDVLRRALQLEIDRRYRSAADFKHALADVADVKPGVAPSMLVDCRTLEFAGVTPGSKTSKSFSIKNVGPGVLTGNIMVTEPWLKVLPNSIDLGQGEQDILVTVDTRGVSPSFDGRGHLNIITNGGTTSIGVRVSTTESLPTREHGPGRRRYPLAIIAMASVVGGILLLAPLWSATKSVETAETIWTTVTEEQVQTVEGPITIKVYSGWMKDRYGATHTVDPSDQIVEMKQVRGPDQTWTLSLLDYSGKEVVYRDVLNYDLTRGTQIAVPGSGTKTVQVTKQVPKEVTTVKKTQVRVSLVQLLLGSY